MLNNGALWAILWSVCCALTGCYYPMTLHDTEATTLSSPYRTTHVSVENGILNVLLDDPSIKDADFRTAKLVDAILVTDDGKEIPLKLWGINHGVGVTFLFKLKDAGFDDDHFGLRVTVSLAGKTTTISGKFTVHGHIKVIDVMESLDHG
jgi:hypothetical protein